MMVVEGSTWFWASFDFINEDLRECERGYLYAEIRRGREKLFGIIEI